MLKVRLKRFGRKKQPSYRIIVIDSKKRRDGRPIEEIGLYHPLKEEKYINSQRMEYYKKNGAKLSKTVESISNNNT
jgi:small subunit ribosomal protein S16